MNKCLECNKIIKNYYAIRCRSCSMIYHYNLIGRKIFKCINCHKKISYGHIRCNSCNKKFQIGKNASNWRGGISIKYCKDRGEKLALYYALRCRSCSHKGKLNPRFNVRPKHTKRIYYKNNCFRSGWEVYFAKWLDLSKIKWEYEKKIFDLGNTTYTPDFYLPEFDYYIEIKGYWFKSSKRKFNLFSKNYSEIKIQILDKKKLKYMGIL